MKKAKQIGGILLVITAFVLLFYGLAWASQKAGPECAPRPYEIGSPH